MTKISNVTRVEAKAEDIQKLAMQLEPFLWDVPRTHAIMALLALSATLMCPELEREEIQSCINGMSEWLCLFLDGREERLNAQEGADPVKELMN